MTREGHRKILIYCRELREDSFLHLDIQGDSYALRRYWRDTDGSVKVTRWKDRQSVEERSTWRVRGRFLRGRYLNSRG